MNASDIRMVEAALKAIDETASICIRSSDSLFTKVGFETGVNALLNIKTYTQCVRDYLYGRGDTVDLEERM